MTRRRETTAIAAGRPPADPGAPLNVPPVPASALHAGAQSNYTRGGHAGWEAFEETMGTLEGGRAVSFASGMAACAAVIAQVPPGGAVVAGRTMYMGVRQLLEDEEARGRLTVRWTDMIDTAAVEQAVDGAALVWMEAPQNPLIDLPDVPAVTEAARAAGAPVAVDATLATPFGLRPLELGATWAVHSATKFVGGHTDLLMGVVTCADLAPIEHHRHIHGATPGALEAFLALRGLRTLALRVERAEANALELATRLDAHPAVGLVRYPGLPGDPGHERMTRFMDGPGGVLSFEPSGGADRSDALIEALELFTHATSFGGVESTLERRARYPEEADIPPALIRVNVGCEHVEDLWEDLERALTATS